MIFETHAHYDDERFEEDRDALITSMPGFYWFYHDYNRACKEI